MNIFLYIMVGCIIQVQSFSRPFSDKTRRKFIQDGVKVEEEIQPVSRLGRPKDEDGKSNIWSVEPKVEVVDDLDKNIVVLGLFTFSVIAVSPLLLNAVFPDPSGF